MARGCVRRAERRARKAALARLGGPRAAAAPLPRRRADGHGGAACVCARARGRIAASVGRGLDVLSRSADAARRDLPGAVGTAAAGANAMSRAAILANVRSGLKVEARHE